MMLRKLFDSLNIVAAFKALGSTTEKKAVLRSLAASQLLVQISTIPVALTIPTVKDFYETDLITASWTVIIRLLILSSTVLLFAKLGQKHGYAPIFIIGGILITVASGLAAISPDIYFLIIWNGFIGLGAAMITATANPILTATFAPNERGKAYSIPIIAARAGTLLGMMAFGPLLEWSSWRLVFFTGFPIGLWCLWNVRGLIKFDYLKPDKSKTVSINYFTAFFFSAMIIALVISLNASGWFRNTTSGINTLWSDLSSGVNLTSMNLQLPIILCFVGLTVCFLILQRNDQAPFFRFSYFKERPGFSMAVFSDFVFHMSMMSTVVLIPILVQEGRGYGPLVASWVLVPGQSLGLIVPILAGFIFDKNDPPWLRPGSLLLIVIGIGSLAIFSNMVPVWGIALLLMIAFLGTHAFNSPSNANVMNNLEEDAAFASGTLEMDRQLGHTIGSTISATVMALALPAASILETLRIESLAEYQNIYRDGFSTATSIVIFTMLSGAIVAGIQSGLFKSLRAGTLKKLP
tara:strand:+ start:5376 stop:6938 length:1563 start_codon:yes stop_codon:yes gene_type:complete